MKSEEHIQQSTLSNHTIKDVSDQLKKLHLSGCIDHLLAQYDEREFVALPFIDKVFSLLNAEIKRREYNSFLRRKKKSHISDNIENHLVNSADDESGLKIDERDYLSQCTWLTADTSRIIAITGKTGVGKSTLGVNIMDCALRKGFKANYQSYNLMMMKATSLYSKSVDDFSEYLNELCNVHVLMLDDFLLSEDRMDKEAECLKEILDLCKEKSCSLIIASQRAMRNWPDCFDDSNLAAAILDRFTEAPILVELSGGSKRTKTGTKLGAKQINE